MLNYFLSAIVVFLGFVIGLVIRHYTKEELEPGKKYFSLLQRLLVLVIVSFFLYSLHVKVYAITVALFIVSTVMYQFPIKLPIYYSVFGAIFFFSPEKLMISAFIFLFGLPSASLIGKDVKKQFKLSLLFFAPVILFKLISLLL